MNISVPTFLFLTLSSASTQIFAEVTFWSDQLPRHTNDHYLTTAAAPHGMQPSTPDYYNVDTSQYRRIDYNDILLMKIDDTFLELGSINNNPSWSGSMKVIHKFMSFSMSDQAVDIETSVLQNPWENYEPRLSNWQQPSNLGRKAANSNDSHDWLNSKSHIRNMYPTYKNAYEKQ